MAKQKYGVSVNFTAGTVFGLCLGVILSTWCRNKFIPCAPSLKRSGCCVDSLEVNFNVEMEQNTKPGMSSSIIIEEKDEKGFMLVGVMTAKKYLDTRAVAAYQTWARSINGRVIFFSSEDSTSKYDIPFVSLKNVDDSYPPQKKSFSMLKYMFNHFIDKYEWFLRVDDDMFLRGDMLEKFLRSVNSSKPHFIGQAGFGTKEEIGLLSLGKNDNYCMGGTGIAFSRETLQKIGPHLKYCVNNLYTTHEDVEVGRCVKQFAGVQCTWSFEMQNLFYQNYKEYKGSFIETLHDKDVQKALTLHPVKMPIHQYRISNHFTSNKIADLRQKEIDLHRQIAEMNQVLNEQTKVINRYGQKPSVSAYTPSKKSDCLGWEFIAKSVSSHLNLNPRKGLTSYHKHALDQVVSQAMDIINRNSRQRGRSIHFKDVLYGYIKTDPLNGASHILDILLTYRKYKEKRGDVPVRRHAYLHQAYTYTEFIDDPLTFQKDRDGGIASSSIFSHFGAGTVPIDSVKLKENIHFIIPLAGKVKEFDRFMKSFEEIALRPKENAQIHVVLFTKDRAAMEVDEILNIIGTYQKKYGGHLFEVIEADGEFSRGKALDLGAKQCAENELLFCVDVDIILSRDALNRIRLNTIRNKQVYYPIVFSQYNPEVVCGKTSVSKCQLNLFDLHDSQGYWRQFGYGIVAMYRSDLEKVGGYDLSIQGWGKEDVDLFEKFIRSNLTVFRAVDTGMIHAFHPIHCDENLDPSQYQMCIGSKATCIGSQRQLAKIVLQTNDIINRNV